MKSHHIAIFTKDQNQKLKPLKPFYDIQCLFFLYSLINFFAVTQKLIYNIIWRVEN